MKKLILIAIVMLSLTNIVLAEDGDQTTNLQEIEYKKLLLEQHAQTKAHFKQELAKRDAELEKKVTSMIDENFRILDDRVDGFIRKATFKFGMAFFSGLVLGGTILLIIQNSLRRKRAIKKHLVQPNERLTLSGDTLHAVKEQTQTVEERIPTPTNRGRKKKQPETPSEPHTINVTGKEKDGMSSLATKTIPPMGDKR